MEKVKKILIWSLIGVALIFFWLSLRSKEMAVTYTLIALGIWLVAMGVNKYYKP